MSIVLPTNPTMHQPVALPIDEQPVRMRTEGGVPAYLAKAWAVAAKDLRSELRAKEVFGVMTTFSVLAVLIFGLAFDLRVPQPEMIVPGVLWVVVLFAGVLGLNRTFGSEVDRGSLAALLLAPVDRSAIYIGKLLANLLFTLMAELLLLPIILVMSAPISSTRVSMRASARSHSAFRSDSGTRLKACAASFALSSVSSTWCCVARGSSIVSPV